jgi:hypothetical protein
MCSGFIYGGLVMFGFIAGIDMNGHAIYQPLPPATESEVEALETLIERRITGARLPKEYRNFLKTINGGCVDPREAEYACLSATSSDGLTSDRVLTYISSLNAHFLEETERWVQGDWGGEMANYFTYVPNDIFPIAQIDADWGGRHEVLVIGIQGPRYGKVYVLRYFVEEWEPDLWKRPLSERLDPEKFIFFVADNFDGFLTKLYPCPQNDE